MTTKKGDAFGKMIINDYSGNKEIILWEEQYVKYNNYLLNGQKLMLQGVYDEHKYRPGVMEFQIQSIYLLEQVRKAFTKRIMIGLPTEKLDEAFVSFFEDNIRRHPGNSEMVLQVFDEANQMAIRLKPGNFKVELNDDLLNFIQQHDYVRFSMDKT